MTTSAAASDKTVNKVALCSAIFAGVAYVGYSVARQAFSRRLVRNQGEALEYEPSPYSRRIFLRRLSGSEASLGTEVLLGTLGSGANISHPGRLILRPLSVQERIRELNVRARHFAETILALQLHDDRSRKASLAYSRSLQSSPTRSRGILSPIDITHLGCASRCDSIENLAHNGKNTWSSASLPPMLKKRWSRRSLKLRNSDSGMFSTREEQDEIEAEGERLLDEREAELRKRLQGFEDGTTKILTPYEAKSLVALLHSKDGNTLEKALVTVSNSAAFTTNQDHLREAGAIVRLQHLLNHPEVCVQRAALTAVGNMALNTSNQKEMGHMVPILLPMIEVSDYGRKGQTTFTSDGEFTIYPVLLTLTNIAALSNWHKQFKGSLTRLLDLTQSENAKIRMQSLRLLVNLSTNEDMVQHLFAAKAPEYVWNMLDEGQAEDQLLRVITLLANLVCTAHKQNLDPTLDLPLDDDKTAEPDSMFSHLYGDENRPDVLEHLESLMTTHPHEDIRVKARMIHNVILASDKRNEDEGE